MTGINHGPTTLAQSWCAPHTQNKAMAQFLQLSLGLELLGEKQQHQWPPPSKDLWLLNVCWLGTQSVPESNKFQWSQLLGLEGFENGETYQSLYHMLVHNCTLVWFHKLFLNVIFSSGYVYYHQGSLKSGYVDLKVELSATPWKDI